MQRRCIFLEQGLGVVVVLWEEEGGVVAGIVELRVRAAVQLLGEVLLVVVVGVVVLVVVVVVGGVDGGGVGGCGVV